MCSGRIRRSCPCSESRRDSVKYYQSIALNQICCALLFIRIHYGNAPSLQKDNDSFRAKKN
jgi:hypothetical protein